MRAFLLSILFLGLPMAAVMANDSSAVLHYLLREPKVKSEHPPLLVLLHGLGSNEEDLFSFAEQLPAQYLVVSARAPISMGNGGYAWYEVDFSTGKPVFNPQQELESRNRLILFIQQIIEKYAVARDQVYLCGFSQGGIMSYSIGLTRPDMVKGIAVMGGRLLEEVKPAIVSPDKLKKLEVFIAHGIQDKVLPIHHARQALAFLQSQGLEPLYKEYMEGHGINGQMLADLIAWLN